MNKLNADQLKSEILKSILAIKDPYYVTRLLALNNNEDYLLLERMGIKIHLFTGANYVEQILKVKPDYVRSALVTNILKKVFGKYALVSLDDINIWKKDREALSSLFRKEKFQQYAPIMIKTIKSQLELWQPFAENNSYINVNEYFTQMTTLNLFNTLFSEIDVDPRTLSILIRELFYLTQPHIFPFVKIGKIPMPFYFKYEKAKKKFWQLADDIIKKSFEMKSENNLITVLAKAYGYTEYNQLDETMKEHLRSEALNFLTAGHDTTAALLIHTYTYFSLYPLIAEKAYAEVQSVLMGREPTYDDLQSFPYLRAVLKEVLRLWPPGILFIRSPQVDDVIEGIKIKTTDLVIVPTFVIQRDARYWPNPEGFDPTRFLQPLTPEQKLAYLPFGKGPQACIGFEFAMIEALFILILLAQRYSLELMPGTTLEIDPKLKNRINQNILMKVKKVKQS